MTTYSDHEQRQLDQQLGAQMDRQTQRREAPTSNEQVQREFNRWVVRDDTQRPALYDAFAAGWNARSQSETKADDLLVRLVLDMERIGTETNGLSLAREYLFKVGRLPLKTSAERR